MCAVIGISSESIIARAEIENLLNQSMIRGKHATGIAWIENDKLNYQIVKYSADKYELPKINTKMLIAHCRYSTSDLNWNQPMTDENIALVHNGVVTQADHSKWQSIYKLNFKTKCDSEILLRHWLIDIHPLHVEGSMSCIVLENDLKPKLHFFRNEQRPLYYAIHNNNYYVASTKDILKRTKIKNIHKSKPCINYTLENNNLYQKKIRTAHEDLQ